mgnify:CR=1 FL=1
MCLLIAQRPGAPTLIEDRIRNAWSHNSDGAGYAFIHDGAVVLRKPFYKLKELLSSYQADHRLHGTFSPFLIHFRFSTHGSISPSNTHPHQIPGGTVVLGHNGILSNFLPPNRDESDTAFFCRTVLAHRHPSQLLDPTFGSEFLAPLIGPANKLVLLSSESPHLSIINEKCGHWEDGHTWYSNNTYSSSREGCFTGWSGEGPRYFYHPPSSTSSPRRDTPPLDDDFDHALYDDFDSPLYSGADARMLDRLDEAATDMAYAQKPDLPSLDQLSEYEWHYLCDAFAEAEATLNNEPPEPPEDRAYSAVLVLLDLGIPVPAHWQSAAHQSRIKGVRLTSTFEEFTSLDDLDVLSYLDSFEDHDDSRP